MLTVVFSYYWQYYKSTTKREKILLFVIVFYLKKSLYTKGVFLGLCPHSLWDLYEKEKFSYFCLWDL